VHTCRFSDRNSCCRIPSDRFQGDRDEHGRLCKPACLGSHRRKTILAECIAVAAETKASGFDSVFIACAKTLGILLITDDKGMYDAAVKIGVKAELLRDMSYK